MQKKKKLLIVVTIVFFLTSTLFYITQKVNGITGNEWILKQKEQIYMLADFSQNLDDVYALYISGAMDKDSFLAEWQRLSDAFGVMEFQRTQDSEKNVVAPEKHTKTSREGAEAINTIFYDFRLLLNASVKDSIPIPRTELLYQHLDYSKKITEELEIFMKAYQKAKEDNET